MLCRDTVQLYKQLYDSGLQCHNDASPLLLRDMALRVT